MLPESYYSEEVRPILTNTDGSAATQAAMARTGWTRSGGGQVAESTISSEFPAFNMEGAGSTGIASQATATEATAALGAAPALEISGTTAAQAPAEAAVTPGASTAATTDAGLVTAAADSLTIPSPSEIGLSNSGVMSAADIVAALTGHPTVSGNPSDLSMSNPVGAPEAAAPTSDQISQVASATAAITTNTGDQGTGTIVHYNGDANGNGAGDYLVTDGHVTGTNPNGIADGTTTSPASQVTATTADGTQLNLGQAIADPSNDLVAYPIQGADAPYTSIPLGDESSLTNGQTLYSVNYGDGQLQAGSGTYTGQMPNIYFFPGGLTPDTGRAVGNTDMPASPGASGAGMVTFDESGQPVYRGTLDNGNGDSTQISYDQSGQPINNQISFDQSGQPIYSGAPNFSNVNSTQFTGASALKKLLDSAAPSTAPLPEAPAPAPTPAPEAPAPAPAPAPEAPAPAPEQPAPAPEAPAPAPEQPAPAPEAPAPAPEQPAPALDAPAPAPAPDAAATDASATVTTTAPSASSGGYDVASSELAFNDGEMNGANWQAVDIGMGFFNSGF